jgi:hypothetical protein
MPYLRHSSPADNPAACSFSTLTICSCVNLLLRMSVSLWERTLPRDGAFKGSRSEAILDRLAVNIRDREAAWRKSGWQTFDPNATPYSADQIRRERELHGTPG